MSTSICVSARQIIKTESPQVSTCATDDRINSRLHFSCFSSNQLSIRLVSFQQLLRIMSHKTDRNNLDRQVKLIAFKQKH
jgi:hypothetical protein